MNPSTSSSLNERSVSCSLPIALSAIQLTDQTRARTAEELPLIHLRQTLPSGTEQTIVELRKGLREMEKRAYQAEGRVRELETQLTQTQAKLSQIFSLNTPEGIRRAFETQDMQISDLKAQLSAEKTIRTKAVAEIQDAQQLLAKIEDLRERLRQSSQEKEHLRQEIKSRNETIARLEMKVTQLMGSQEKERLQQEIASRDETIAGLRNQLSASSMHAQATLATAWQQNSFLQQELDTQREMYQKFCRDMTAAHHQEQALSQRRVQELEQASEASRQEKNALETRVGELLGNLQRIEEELNTMRRDQLASVSALL